MGHVPPCLVITIFGVFPCIPTFVSSKAGAIYLSKEEEKAAKAAEEEKDSVMKHFKSNLWEL